MATGSKTLTGRLANDASVAGVLESFAVPSGEVWYVEDIGGYLTVDETGAGNSVYTYEIETRIESTHGKTLDTTVVKDVGTSDDATDQTVALGKYVYPGDSVIVEELADSTYVTSEIEYRVTMRRVL